jgi:hypothetical protein
VTTPLGPGPLGVVKLTQAISFQAHGFQAVNPLHKSRLHLRLTAQLNVCDEAKISQTELYGDITG